jgi:hypothetical protein
MQKNLGATAEEWQWAWSTFGKYILPTICGVEHNGVELKGYLKIPSLISKQDGVPKRIAAWNTFEAKQKNINDWSSEPCHGICLRTHEVQAIDIDYEDYDAGYSIAAFFKEQLGDLPTRVSKLHTGRQALLLRVTGIPEGKRLKKRHIYAKDGSSGATELIAQNSQLVIAGTHSSQTCRYTWLGGLPTEIPEVDYNTLKDVWEAAIKLFGTPSSTSISTEDTYEVDNTGVDIEQDPFAQYVQSWSGGALFRRFVSNSKLAMRCPWENEHSTEDREDSTSTIYMAANKDKPAQFVCKHAHSKGDRLKAAKTLDNVYRFMQYTPTDEDFEHAREVRHADIKESKEQDWVLVGKNRVIDPKAMHNLYLAMKMPELIGGMSFAHDEFTGKVVDTHTGKFVPITDNTYNKARRLLSKSSIGFRPAVSEVESNIYEIAYERVVSSALHHLDRLPKWDGKARLDRYASDILRAKPSEYASYLGRFLFVSVVTKLMHPEEVCEAVIMLQGEQGCGKSAAVKLSALHEDLYFQGELKKNPDDLVRLFQGKSIMEWAELDGKANHDDEAIKSFVTRVVDRIIPKFKNHEVAYKRHCIIVGTTNADRFLSDPTGSRRFFPLRVGITAPMTDFDLLEEWRDQLYAEAMAMVKVDKLTMRKMYRYINDNLAEKFRSSAYEDSLYHGDIKKILEEHEQDSISLIDLWSAICNRRGRIANPPNKNDQGATILSAQKLGWELRRSDADGKDNGSEGKVLDKVSVMEKLPDLF